MIHAFTVDVEDYDNITLRDLLGLAHNLPPTDAVVRNTRRVLDLLAAHDTHGTFFVLGEVAEAFPQLVAEIAEGGHEVGVHGYHHRLITELSVEDFRREVRDARRRLEDIAQRRVIGHRAPVFTVVPETAWALEVLAEEGYRYDTSIFPFRGRRYGWEGFNPEIARVRLPSGRELIEAPMTTVGILGKRLPSCGGGYLRLFPLWWTRWAIRQASRQRPAIVYLHPYEVDAGAGPLPLPEIPKPQARSIQRFHRRQLCRRRSVVPKLNRLLRTYAFAPLADVISARLGPGALADQ